MVWGVGIEASRLCTSKTCAVHWLREALEVCLLAHGSPWEP